MLLVQSGDTAAFEKLLLRLHEPLRNYLVKLVGLPMAEDVLQDVALRMFQNIRHLREIRAFRPWIYRIVTRTAFVHLKREKKWHAYEADPQSVAALASSRLSDHHEFDSDFWSMLDRLSPASRAVLLLHYQQNLSLEETAAILGIPMGTVKSRFSYGVTKLRKFMEEKQSK